MPTNSVGRDFLFFCYYKTVESSGFFKSVLSILSKWLSSVILLTMISGFYLSSSDFSVLAVSFSLLDFDLLLSSSSEKLDPSESDSSHFKDFFLGYPSFLRSSAFEKNEFSARDSDKMLDLSNDISPKTALSFLLGPNSPSSSSIQYSRLPRDLPESDSE